MLGYLLTNYIKLNVAFTTNLRPTFHIRTISSKSCHSLNKSAAEKLDISKSNAAEVSIDRKQILDHSFRSNVASAYAKKMSKSRKQIAKLPSAQHYGVTLEFRVSELEENIAVFLMFDDTSYCINMFPDFERHAICRKLKYKTVNNLFFTKLDWNMAIYGISSAARKMIENYNSENNQSSINVCGPPGMKDIALSALSVVHSVKGRQKVKNGMFFEECYDDINIFKRGNTKITCINLRDGSLVPHAENSMDVKSNIVCSYIFEYSYRKRTGSNPTSEENLLINSWHNFSTIEGYIAYLKNELENLQGSCVQDDKTITVVVLDCPNINYFNMMLQKDEVLNHHKSSSNVNCIVHVSPREVYSLSKYQQWMNEFGDNCMHIMQEDILNETKSTPITYAYRSYLHTLDPYFFPLHGNKKVLQTVQNWLNSSLLPINQSFKVRASLETGNFSAASYMSPSFKDCLELAKPLQDIFSKPIANFTKALYPRLVVIGSGSSFPTRLRSSPSYLLFIDADTSIIVDCGLGTRDQLYNHFGNSQVPKILSTVKAIFVTHKHSDHWSGLFQLLETIHLYRNSGNLFVVLPSNIRKFLLRVFTTKSNTKKDFLKNVNLIDIDGPENNHLLKTIARFLKVKNLKVVAVDHGVPTFGIIIELLNGEKVVYSSDTLPMCKNLIEEGKNADLLLHDCLYTDESNVALATLKMHSTLRGAIATAQSMKAKNVMLTHFAALCGKLPLTTLHHDEPYNGQILYALDHLEIPLCQLNQFPSLHDKLSPVFQSKRKLPNQRTFRVAQAKEELQDSLKMQEKRQNF